MLEVRPHGDNLMYQIFHTDYAKFPQVLLDDLIVGQRDALLIDFAVSPLVNQIADCFDGRIAVGNEGFNDFEHFRGGFGDLYENTVVDLEKTKELEDFARFWGNLVNTVRGQHVSSFLERYF